MYDVDLGFSLWLNVTLNTVGKSVFGCSRLNSSVNGELGKPDFTGDRGVVLTLSTRVKLILWCCYSVQYNIKNSSTDN